MPSMFQSSVLLLCSLAMAQEGQRPKTTLMRSNREEVKSTNDKPAEKKNIFDLRKKHSENPPPPAVTDDVASPASEPEHKKVFDIHKIHSEPENPTTPAETEHKKVFDIHKIHSDENPTTPAETEHKKVFDIHKIHSDENPATPAEPAHEKIFDIHKIHAEPPTSPAVTDDVAKPAADVANPAAEAEHKKVFDIHKIHGPEEKPAPSVIHVENMYKSQSTFKPASNFVVVEPKKPTEAPAEPKTHARPISMREAAHAHQHGGDATPASGGWMSFFLSMAVVISFLIAMAGVIVRQLGVVKPGQEGQFLQQIAGQAADFGRQQIKQLQGGKKDHSACWHTKDHIC